HASARHRGTSSMSASQATDPRFPRPPPGEAERLAELQRYALLDTPPDEAFDDLVAIAAAACDAPMAAVTLIDAERQWMKAAHGMTPVECPRPDSFCAHALLVPDEVMVVADAARDPRSRENPWVTGAAGIRFYAGAPLVTPAGHPLGALCVLDRVPRTLSPERQRALRGLARQAVAQIELRRAYAELRHHAAERAWYEQQMESVWRQMAEQNARLTQASLTDELTGLPNRRAAGLRLAQLLEGLASGDGPLAVAIADIDFFKAINDRHGHPVGDDVLLRVAGALGAHAPFDAMVARLGGEEFVILLPGLSVEDAVRACDAMRAAVAGLEDGHPVTVSIGVTASTPGDDVSSLYSRADRALYIAK